MDLYQPRCLARMVLHIPGDRELTLPQNLMLNLPGGWKVLIPRQARKLRLVSTAHAKLPDKEVGVS